MAENVELAVTSGERRDFVRARGLALSAPRLLEWSGFVAVVGVSLGMNTWNLTRNGYGNTYYAAAVRSMTLSWNNFFFGAFDPGGFITVDKPPVFLWVGAISARVFGYSSWSILLPSALAGAATVALLWFIVRRYFGPLAAAIAGAALALSPITVAVDRLNLPEPLLILMLLGSAGAILWSLDSRRWWAWTLLAGALVGLAFNTKMLAAWIPGPALVLGIIAAWPRLYQRESLRRAAMQLAILGAATLTVSASWMLVVDHWPGDRPYIGGSKDNTVQNLILEYNGVGRVEGNERPGGVGPRPAQVNQPPANIPNGPGVPPAAAQPNRAGTAPGGTNGAGGIIAGSPGLWRMFDAANGPQIAWLLPLALLGAVPALYAWRQDRGARAAIVLFAGWVLCFGLVFSFAKGIYHSYYTAAMAPGVAALAGISVAAALKLARRDLRWLVAFVPAVVITALVQVDIVGRFPGYHDGVQPIALAVLGFGAVLVMVFAARRSHTWLPLGVAGIAAGLLVIPSTWSWYEVTNPSANTTLPQAGPRQGAAARSFGSQAFDGGVASLAAWLTAHRDASTRWDLAASSAMNSSTLIARYELSVMAIGGFSGSDPTISVAEFAGMVEDGDIRYVLTQGGPGGPQPNAGSGRTLPGGIPPNQPGSGGALQGPGRAPVPGVNGPQGTVPGPVPGGTGPVPGGTGPRPGGQQVTPPGFNPGAVPSVGAPPTSAVRGANAVISAVRSACVPVTGVGVPSNYQGSLFDCAGRADRLRAAVAGH